jgi:hypothetical protein
VKWSHANIQSEENFEQLQQWDAAGVHDEKHQIQRLGSPMSIPDYYLMEQHQ